MRAPDGFFCKNSKIVGLMYILLVTGSDPGSNSLGFGVLGFAKKQEERKRAGIPGG